MQDHAGQQHGHFDAQGQGPFRLAILGRAGYRDLQRPLEGSLHPDPHSLAKKQGQSLASTHSAQGLAAQFLIAGHQRIGALGNRNRGSSGIAQRRFF